jgi:hypothetical protein
MYRDPRAAGHSPMARRGDPRPLSIGSAGGAHFLSQLLARLSPACCRSGAGQNQWRRPGVALAPPLVSARVEDAFWSPDSRARLPDTCRYVPSRISSVHRCPFLYLDYGVDAQDCENGGVEISDRGMRSVAMALRGWYQIAVVFVFHHPVLTATRDGGRGHVCVPRANKSYEHVLFFYPG